MKFKILRFGILALLFVPLFFINIRDSHDWGDDFAQYILQAKNLVEGKPQTEGAYIFNPDYPLYAPPIYTVGYPVLLAPVYAVFGNNIRAFNYYQTFLLFLFGVAIFFFLRRFMDDIPAILLTLIIVYNPWMLQFKAAILSDLPFTLFILLSTIAYLNFREKQNWSNGVLTGCLVGFTILIKPVGVMLAGAIMADVVITLIKKREFKKEVITQQLLLLGITLIFYLLVTKLLIPSAVETTGHFKNLYGSESLIERFNENAPIYIMQLHGWFEDYHPDLKFAVPVLRAFVLALFLLGFFGKLFTRQGFIEIFTVLFLLVILLFPDTSQGSRYLLPVFPFILLFVYHGFESIQLGKLNRKIVFAIACCFCLFQFKSGIVYMWKQEPLIAPGPQQPTAIETFEFINKNIEKGEVIACVKPRALSLYTGHRGINSHPEQERASMKSFFEKYNVSYYLVLKDWASPAMEEMLRDESDSFEVIWSNERFTMYRKKV